MEGFSTLIESSNFVGWFLSKRGPDAEESISRFLKFIDEKYLYSPYYAAGIHKRQPLPVAEHRLGVELLVPRHEKLHFEGAGFRLTNHLSAMSSEPTLTSEQRERWTNAFKTLAANLRCVNVVHSPLVINLTELLLI